MLNYLTEWDVPGDIQLSTGNAVLMCVVKVVSSPIRYPDIQKY